MKKATALILTAAMVFCAAATVIAQNVLKREDIPPLTDGDHEARAMAELGMLVGAGNGFELQKELTRAEALVFILRTTGLDLSLNSYDFDAPPFTDIRGHWAEEIILQFYGAGLVSGRGNERFMPDEVISGKEFTKILLSALGYESITLENAREKGEKCGILVNNFTRSVVINDERLTRGDAVRICYCALTAFNANHEMLYESLIESGKYKERDFEGVLYAFETSAKSFSARIDGEMPEDANYMFSPFSIKMAFALAANGAGGTTRSEILSALGIQNIDEYNKNSERLIKTYAENGVMAPDVANSIWINTDETNGRFSEGFKKNAEKYFNAEAASVNSADAVKRVNSWVAEKTNEKIISIINDSDFASLLVNAVYFRGAWENEFSESATKKAPFTACDGKEYDTDFMNLKEYYEYYNKNGVEAVKMPYKSRIYQEDGEIKNAGFEASMYLIMGECEDAEEFLKSAEFESRYLRLFVPKFEFEYEISLNGIMNDLGIKEAFGTDADFTEMFDSGSMTITESKHKTYVKVDEKGTEAAAVTSIALAKAAMPPEPTEVRFDEPFTFVVKDDTNGEILFLGKYQKP